MQRGAHLLFHSFHTHLLNAYSEFDIVLGSVEKLVNQAEFQPQ